MRGREILNEYYNEKSDKYTVVRIDHKRRPRITLRHLQKLRKTRSVEQIEQEKRIKDVAYIYGKKDSDMEI